MKDWETAYKDAVAKLEDFIRSLPENQRFFVELYTTDPLCMYKRYMGGNGEFAFATAYDKACGVLDAINLLAGVNVMRLDLCKDISDDIYALQTAAHQKRLGLIFAEKE